MVPFELSENVNDDTEQRVDQNDDKGSDDCLEDQYSLGCLFDLCAEFVGIGSELELILEGEID